MPDDDDDDKEERKGGGLFHSIMTTSAKVRTSSKAHTAANTHRNTVVSYILLVFSFFFSYLFVLYRKCFSCVISRETRPAIPPKKSIVYLIPGERSAIRFRRCTRKRV